MGSGCVGVTWTGKFAKGPVARSTETGAGGTKGGGGSVVGRRRDDHGILRRDPGLALAVQHQEQRQRRQREHAADQQRGSVVVVLPTTGLWSSVSAPRSSGARSDGASP